MKHPTSFLLVVHLLLLVVGARLVTTSSFNLNNNNGGQWSVMKGIETVGFQPCRLNSLNLHSRASQQQRKGRHPHHHHLHRRRQSTMIAVNQNTSDSNERPANNMNVPYVKGVTLKMAFDQSYAVADDSELKSGRFTCPSSLDLVHKLRRCSDAVLVGRGTVERDDCTLTVRRVALLEGMTEQPVRVVVDPGLKILQVGMTTEVDGDGDDNGGGEKVGCKYSLLKDDLRTIVYHDESAADRGDDDVPFLSKMVTLASIKSTNDGTLSPTQILQDLQAKGISHVMVEGGPATALQFLREGVVDRAIMIRAPVTFIEPVRSNMSNQVLKDAGLVLLSSMSCGDDIVEYWSKNGNDWPGKLSVEDGWPC